MGAGKSIMQSEDIKKEYDAGNIDLSAACEKDAICPPSKFIANISKFANKYDDNLDIKYILIFLFLLLFLTSIHILNIKKYI